MQIIKLVLQAYIYITELFNNVLGSMILNRVKMVLVWIMRTNDKIHGSIFFECTGIIIKIWSWFGVRYESVSSRPFFVNKYLQMLFISTEMIKNYYSLTCKLIIWVLMILLRNNYSPTNGILPIIKLVRSYMNSSYTAS